MTTVAQNRRIDHATRAISITKTQSFYTQAYRNIMVRIINHMVVQFDWGETIDFILTKNAADTGELYRSETQNPASDHYLMMRTILDSSS